MRLCQKRKCVRTCEKRKEELCVRFFAVDVNFRFFDKLVLKLGFNRIFSSFF